MSTTHWALSVAYWLHMLATVAWMGGLAALAWLVLPAARKSMAAGEYAQFLNNLQKRFDPLAWFSLVDIGWDRNAADECKPELWGPFLDQ